MTILVNEITRPFSQPMDSSSFTRHYGDDNVIIRFLAKNLEYLNHWKVLSVHCAFKGNEYYNLKKFTYRVSNSNFLLLNEGTERSSFISSTSLVESFSIYFSPNFVNSWLSSVLGGSAELLDDPFFSSSKSFQLSEQLFEHAGLMSTQLLNLKRLINNFEDNQGEIDELTGYLFESMIYKQKEIWEVIRKVDRSKESTRKELYERLIRAKDYLFSCFTEEISNRDLANLTCLNEHYFSREFRKMFGFAPHQYLQYLRLNEARRLVSSTNKTIKEICYEVGYNDASSFCRLFKRQFNHYPLKYRIARASLCDYDEKVTLKD